jgi:2-amino-4-hydroxy-6-hydroxymethyldihydropteridine diphosphokinase
LRAAIALGSNLGDREANLRIAIDGLGEVCEVGDLTVSSFHDTAPVGPPQPRYLNAAVVLDCDLDPAELHTLAKQLEERAGRTRTPGDRWGPRTLDVDLLLCDDRVIETDSLTIPHPGMPERSFVLDPLVEIAPEWVVPGLARTVKELHADLLLRR